MNEPRSSRYHRLRRRAACAQGAVAGAVLAGLLAGAGSAWLRDLAGGAPAAYALLLVLVLEGAMLPLAWYRTFVLERQYGGVRAPVRQWLRDYGSGVLLTTGAAVAAADLLYRYMRAWPDWWWLPAAASGILLAWSVVWLAPVAILPLFHPSRPLAREPLRQRLVELAGRLGIAAPAVHETCSAPNEPRAYASIVGLGPTRRVLLSATLLADYADDEIEIVVAHEIGHHVHRDVPAMLGIELVLLTGGLWAGSIALEQAWHRLGLISPADPAGLPLLVLVAAGARVLVSPVVAAVSRHQERRADRYALAAVSRPEALVSVLRRMAARNLVEEHPSRVAFWLFHTHPTVQERMAMARAHRSAEL